MKIFDEIPDKYATRDFAQIALLAVPYDETSTWMKGADKGPAAILETARNLELYDIETNSEVWREGIYVADTVTENSSPEAMVQAVCRAVSKLRSEGKFIVTLGGEHSVSIGAIQAHIDDAANPTVLQFDAHADLRETYMGSKYNHACVMARAREMAEIVQVGIRSMCIEEKKHANMDRIFFAQDISGRQNWYGHVLSKLNEDVYITIDLDVFDPSIMPSTGTPEPGGLHWYEVLGLLKLVFEKHNVIGCDIVELCPNPANKAPDLLAAKLLYKLLSYKFSL